MARLYTKVEELAEIIVQRQEAGETYREIGASLGLGKPYVCAVLDLCEKAVLA